MTKRIRTLSINDLETPTRRLKLAPRIKPYWSKIVTGIALGYRAGPGSWNVRTANGKGGNYIRIIGQADDREPANGNTVLTYTQALDRARLLGRGGDAEDPHAGKRIVTVGEAVKDYKADLIARRKHPGNASQARYHLPRGLLDKPVTMLNARELKAWRNGLLASGEKPASINRRCQALKAALNLAAREDNRIVNVTAWTYGLSKLAEDTGEAVGDNILDDDQRATVISEAYKISEHLGIYIELHAATGMRSSQIRLIKVRDLKLGREPTIEVPSSLKGRNRTVRKIIPLPISAALASRLKAYAAGRKPGDPLTLHPDGRDWTKKDLHRKPVRRCFEAAGMDPDAITIYCLRHTAITRALLRNLPVRLVAASFDTSVAMIEKTYSRFIVVKGNDQLRAALVGDAVSSGNVISLRG